jgi:hypothetical protein
MPGPLPKAPDQRRRRNRASTAKELRPAVTPLAIPDLPHRDDGSPWHEQALTFWRATWSSPVATEYDVSDVAGLFLLADLYHTYWSLPPEAAIKKKEIASEIRLSRRDYGHTPMSRRSLQWQIAQADDATDRREARKVSRSGGTDDPRLIDIEPLPDDTDIM